MAKALKAGDVIEVTLTNKKGKTSQSQKAVVQKRITPKPVFESLRQGDMIATGKIPTESIVTVKLNSKSVPIGSIKITGDRISIKAPKGHFAFNDKIEVTAKQKDCLPSKEVLYAKYDREDDFLIVNLEDEITEGYNITVVQGDSTIGTKTVDFQDIQSKYAKINIARPIKDDDKVNILFKDISKV